MSAIAGIHYFAGEPVSAEIGRCLMEELSQVRTDRMGVWTSGSTFFGCRARWFTPESVDEELPRADRTRGLAITADAILDNRDALLAQFAIEPAKLASTPDSELILLAYAKWGDEAPARLVGDFAFVIWDEPRRRLFGARDHSGKRTLYFHRNSDRFAFCTLLKPLLALPGVEKRLNEQWLSEFLAITGMVDTADSSKTIYLDIEQVPPAHRIVCEDGRVTVTEYCRLTPGETLKLRSDAEYEEAFREVFGAAVRSRLRSRLPIGAQLSGGLDSGTVVSFAARELGEEGRSLQTFSYVPERNFTDWTSRHLMANETAYMKATAGNYGNIEASFHDFAGTSPLTEMDEWLDLMEMPYKFFENSYWVKGIYREASDRGIGVLFNGGRGNFTISWGPALDYYAMILKRLQLIRFIRELGAYSRNMGVSRSRVLSVVGAKAFPALSGFGRQAAAKPEYIVPTWIHPDFAARTGVFERLADQGFDVYGSSTLVAADAIEARIKHFEHGNIWNASGTSFAKLSLRFGVQGHDPTNDLRVIRFCLSLPLDQFVREGSGRSLVRRSTKGILADEVRLNRRMRGVQAADWLHRIIPVWNEFIHELENVCKSPLMREIVNMDVLRGALARFKAAPKEEHAFDPELRILVRSLIVYRYLHTAF